jgi:hypothetical protein
LLAANRNQPEFALAVDKLAANRAVKQAGGWANNPSPSEIASLFANYLGDMPRATAAVRDALRENDGWVVMPLLGGPHGARLPEEASMDPDWLAVWNDPKLRETMAAYRANIAAFRRGE